MENITIQEILFQSFPEILLLVVLGTTLVGRKISIKNLLLIVIIMTAISYFTTKLPGGFRTLGLLLNYIFILLIFSNLRIIEIVLAAILSIVCEGIVEMIYYPTFLYLTSFTTDDIISNSYLRIIGFIPEALILLVFILLLKKYKISILYWNNKLTAQYQINEDK